MGAAAVKEEMRALAPPQVEGAKGDEKSAATFEFCMEELYRKLFQAEESLERERQLNALYKECGRYVRHTQPTPLSKECGRLSMQYPSAGVGSFDIQTRQVLWKYAAMAWQERRATEDLPPRQLQDSSKQNDGQRRLLETQLIEIRAASTIPTYLTFVLFDNFVD